MPRVGRAASIATIWGQSTCQEQAPEGGGCTVFVDTTRHVWVSTSHGFVTTAGRMLAVSDVAPDGRVTALLSRRTADRGPCWGVVGPDGHRHFRTCTSYLAAFSPNGRWMLAEQPATRWQSVRGFSVLGRNGRSARAWTFHARPHTALSQLTWEDDHHLLGVLRAQGRWSVVRIGTDGTVEYAVAPVSGGDDIPPLSLPLR
jgi:hypothetical protein